MKTLRTVAAALLVCSANTAFAGESEWGLPPKGPPPPLPTAPPPGAYAPLQTVAPAVTPALYNPAAARAAPAPAPAEEPSCAVNQREGFTDADVSAVEQVVCGQVREKAPPGRYRIHLGKLGAKVVLTLVECVDGTTSERQVVLSDLGEVSVAAPRLVEAQAEKKAVADTLDVSNVVGDEARTPKKRASHVHAWLGMIGAGGGGGTGGGANLGISAGSERWSFVGDLRLAGEAFNKPAALAGAIFTLGATDIDPKASFSFVSVSGGVRHHFFATDVAPFLGVGLGIDYIAYGELVRPGSFVYRSSGGSGTEDGKAGLAGYTELGLDVFRTHVVGGAVLARLDLPAFAVEQKKADPLDDRRYLARSAYTPIFTAGVALRF